MRPELSMQVPDKAGSERQFFAENGSKFEPLLIKTLCEPLLPHIPRGFTPNAISLTTHAVAWLTAIFALSSVYLAPFPKAMALIGAGIGMFISMVGDCIDGLHARRTNQTSKLGELMDHWLDAIIVPLVTVGITSALQMDPWAYAAVNITAAMVYNAQLVLYHHTGKFVVPEPATGVEAQFGVSLGYIAMAGFFYYVDRHQPWLDLAFGVLALAGVVVQLRCSYFFYPKLGRFISEHLWFVGLCSGFAVLYLMGILERHVFLFTVVFTSFRICGTYVLNTITKAPFNGRDLGLLAFIVVIFAVHYGMPQASIGPVTLPNALAVLACVYAIARNLIDLARRFTLLKPNAG